MKAYRIKQINEEYAGYQTPKAGIFRIDTNEYDINVGWINKEEKHLIIGETPLFYITRMQETRSGLWIGEMVIYQKFTYPLGIHKSRFVKWIPTQLSFF